MDELVEAVNNLTINDAKYYESDTSTANDSQGDLTRNPETVTHTSNGNETVTHTSNGNFGQILLSYRTIPFLPHPKNLGIYQGVATIRLAPQTLMMPTTK